MVSIKSVSSLNLAAPHATVVAEGVAPEQPVDTFERTKALFWTTLEAGKADDLAKQLDALPPAERSRLANTPKAGVEPGLPKLPLCVAAAHGSIPLMRAMLQPFAAYPLAGEMRDDLVLTALFWAASYGVRDSIDFLHDTYGLPASQVLMACEESATEQLVTWLKKHGISGAALDQAMQHAVERNDMESIVNLTEHGNARVNIPATSNPEERATLLCYAIANGKSAAAGALIDAGADPNGQAEVDVRAAGFANIALNEQPMWLAISGHHLGLVRRLLASGATCSAEHLKHALSQSPTVSDTDPRTRQDKQAAAAAIYVALTDGDVAPRTVAEAADLQRVAIASDHLDLIGLVTAQKTLLERTVAREKEGKSVRKDEAYKHALAQVTHATAALRDATDAFMRPSLPDDAFVSFTLPAGVAILTDSEPVVRKAKGFAKLTRKLKTSKYVPAAPPKEEHALELAKRRHR